MKKLMKYLVLLLLFVMIFGLVGCLNGGDKEKNGEKKIVVLLLGLIGYFVVIK